jgi:Glyoxalase superfamily protein
MRPGIELAPSNARVMEVIDPFGNRLRFNEPVEQGAAP